MIFSAAGGWFGKGFIGNIDEAAAHGFKAIEQLTWTGVDLTEARKHLDAYNMTHTCIVIRSHDNAKNEITAWKHGMVWADSRDAFIESFKESIEAAHALGCPNICATTGNERFDVSREEQFKICVETLSILGEMAAKEGIQIVLEPLNILVNHMGYFLVTTKEAVRMIQEVNNPAVKILFDIYHQQISEGNVIRNATENIDLIGHFHIGDNPGRKEPGTGEINYANVFKAIKETGYNKFLAFECGRTIDIDPLCEKMHTLCDPFES